MVGLYIVDLGLAIIHPFKGSDFIHASYIRGLPFKMICAQGPLGNEIDRFWMMVAQEKISIIVQLCQNREGGREKCSNYLPENDAARHGPVVVNVIEPRRVTPTNPNVKLTRLQLTVNNQTLNVFYE